VAAACKISHLHDLKQGFEIVCIDICRFGNLSALLYFLCYFERVTFVSALSVYHTCFVCK